MTTLYTDSLFAPLDADLCLERIGGGNETEVYCTDDRRDVVKVKSEDKGAAGQVLHRARHLRHAADRFARIVGRHHSLPNYFIVTGNKDQAQLVMIQPYCANAQPLFTVDYATLSTTERRKVARQ